MCWSSITSRNRKRIPLYSLTISKIAVMLNEAGRRARRTFPRSFNSSTSRNPIAANVSHIVPIKTCSYSLVAFRFCSFR